MLKFLSIGTQGATQGPDFDDTPAPEFLHPDWMAQLPDSTSLSEVSLAGTHNTMAFYGGRLVQCQAWPLRLQLEAGVRFLDIRVRYTGDTLALHHGPIYQKANFDLVVRETIQFLKDHPTETILMRVKEEFSTTYNIYDAVVRYLKEHGDWEACWNSRDIPTMGQARGKLIVLQDFSGNAIGMKYSSLDIGDDWKVPTLLHINQKWDSVKNHLDTAKVGNNSTLFLTYSSGAGILAYPDDVAKRINARLYEYLNNLRGQKTRFGMIGIDFPSAWLIKMIIEFN